MLKKVASSGLLILGYLLSPLSWWNDLLLNIPLAYAFASLFGYFSRSLFMPMMIVGYWLSNLAGFILMHIGAKGLMLKNDCQSFGKALRQNLLVSVLYSTAMLLLIYLGYLKPPF
jgi:hypothetical protein